MQSITPQQTKAGAAERKADLKNDRHIQQLDRQRRRLKRAERWPTSEAVQFYRDSGKTSNVHRVKPACSYRSYAVVYRPNPRSYMSFKTSPTYMPAPENLFEASEFLKADFLFPIIKGQHRESHRNSQFTLFSSLPPELRIQVWEFALRQPELFEAQLSSPTGIATLRGPCTGRPKLLSVCHESRVLAQTIHYTCLHPLGMRSYLIWHDRVSLNTDKGRCAKAIFFVPDSDTIFHRSLDVPSAGLLALSVGMHNADKIQHLALPLPAAGWGFYDQWKMAFVRMKSLKTLTLMIGGRDNSWLGRSDIVLRDVEEWFADGRDRKYNCGGWMMDIEDVVKYLSGRSFEEMMRRPAHVSMPGFRGINVRAVAWTKSEK